MNSPEEVKPYDDKTDKGEQVEQMFDSIAPAYDFMNTAMTFGLHRRWRDKALRGVCAALEGVARAACAGPGLRYGRRDPAAGRDAAGASSPART